MAETQQGNAICLKRHEHKTWRLGVKTRDLLLCGLEEVNCPPEFCSSSTKESNFIKRFIRLLPNLKVLILNPGAKPQNTD